MTRSGSTGSTIAASRVSLSIICEMNESKNNDNSNESLAQHSTQIEKLRNLPNTCSYLEVQVEFQH